MKFSQLLKKLLSKSPIIVQVFQLLSDEWYLRNQSFKNLPQGFKFGGKNKLMISGEFEREETIVIDNYLENVDIFIDIGANIGYYTCLARSKGKNTIAFEPSFRNLKYLYANLLENEWSDVEVIPLGLGSHPRIDILFGSGSGASLIPGWAGTRHASRQIIPISTLDNLIAYRCFGKKLFVKMDVEGFEYQVLQGSNNTLTLIPKPIWLIEITLTQHHPSGINPNYMETFEIFWNAGYDTFSCEVNPKQVFREDVEDWINKKRCSHGTQNFLFVWGNR